MTAADVVAMGLPWLALAGGLGLLLVRRGRSPRAVGVALPAVGGLLLVAAVPPADALFGVGDRVARGWDAVLPWAVGVGAVVLAVAAMADRRPGGRA